jgi:hypothetical protein
VPEVREGRAVEQGADERRGAGAPLVHGVQPEQQPGHRHERRVVDPQLRSREAVLPFEHVAQRVQRGRGDRREADRHA